MSTTIDSRVVEMRFDNKNFENNVKTSMSTLDKLKQCLQLKGASKGLENLDKTAKKVDMSPISKGIETVSLKFSALQVAGVTALANITNSAVNAGKRIVESLTIAPVMDGFSEYEMTLNAVQTTMAGTGKTAKEVEVELKKLDEYADKTVYSTADMLNNLPKFTNAGVELEKATTAMIGIANATALAGGDASKASIAFYNLGQAIGTGYLTRMDYNSINNAGIATMEWKNQMVEAAIAQGTLTKTGEDAYKAGKKTFTLQQLFIDGLQEQWATTEVMMKVFGDYGNETTKIGEKAYSAAQDIKTFSQMMESLKATAGTGWKDTWQIIFGDLDEAKEFWTGLSNAISEVINRFADFRNKLLKGALGTPLSNFSEKIQGIGTATEKAAEQMKDYSDIVDRVINGEFGNMQKRWDALSEAGYDWAKVQNLVNEKLGSSVRYTEKLTDAQNDNAAQTIELTDAKLTELGLTKEEIKLYRELEKQSKETGKSIDELIESMSKPSGRDLLIDSFKNIGEAIMKPFNAIKEAWNNTFDGVDSEDLYKLIEKFHELSEAMIISDEAANNFKRVFEGLFAGFQLANSVFSMSVIGVIKIASAVLELFGTNLLEVAACLADYIVKFRDWVEENTIFIGHFDKIGAMIHAVIDGVKKCASAFMSLDAVKKVIESIRDTLSKLFGDISGGLPEFNINGAIEAIKNAFDKLENWIKGLNQSENIGRDIINGLVNGIKAGAQIVIDAIIQLGTTILNTIKGVLGIHSPSTEFFEIGKNIIQGLINGLQNGLGALWGVIKNVGLKCIEFLKKIDWGAVLAGGISVGIIYTAKKLSDAIEILAAPLEGVGDLLSGVGKAFSGLGKALGSFADKWKAKKWEAISKIILSVGISIGILAASVYVLAQIEPGKLWGAIGALAALAAIVTVLSLVASKIKSEGSFVKLAVMLVGVSAALLIMASALKKLEFLNENNIGPILGGLAAMIVGLSLVLLSFGTFVRGKAAQNIDKAGVMLLKMSMILLSLVFVIKQVSKLDPAAMTKGGLAIVAFGGIVTGLIAATKLAGRHIDKAGSTMLKISAAMILLVTVIKLVSKLEPGVIAKGMICIALFGSMMVGFIAMTKLFGKDATKVGGTLFGISAAILMMVITIQMVARLDPGALAKGIICVALLGGVIAGLVAATQLAGDKLKRVGLTLLTMSAAIGILAATAIILSLIDIGGLAKGVIAVGLLGSVMALMIHATKGAQDCKGSITAMAIAIGIMAAAVAALSFIDPKKLAGATIALSTVMGMFALIVKASGSATSSIGPLIVMTVAVGLMAGMIFLLSHLDVESSLTNVAAISLLMVAMSAALHILSGVGGLITNALLGIVGLLAMAVPLLAFVGVLAVMQNIQNATANAMVLTGLATAMTLLLIPLTLIGVLIGATGGIAALGIVALLAMAIPLLALVGVLAVMQNIQNATANTELLTTLLTTMSDVLIKVSLVGPLAMMGVKAITSLTGVMLAIGALAAVVGALVTKFPQLEEFVNTGIPVLETLASGLGSIIGSFVGGFAEGVMSGLPGIGTSLSQFMMNAMPFITGAKLIDSTVMDGVATLSKAVLTLTAANVIEGLTSWLTGGSSLTDFGAQLAEFGPQLSLFSNSVANVNPETITAAANGTKLLAEALATIPFDWNHNEMTMFGEQLASFGPNLASFGGSVANINSEIIIAAAKATKTLAEALATIPFDWNHNEMIKFGEQLVSFGPDLAEFAGSVAGIDTGATKSAADATKKLAEALKSIPFDWGHNELSLFGEQLVSFGSKLKSFASTVAGIDSASMTSAINTVSSITKIEFPDTTKIASFSSSIDELVSTLSNLGSFNSESVNSFKTALTDLATTSIDGFVETFSGSSDKAKQPVTDLINAVTTLATNSKQTIYQSFYSVGSYLVDGFAAGISANTYKATAKATAMAKAAETAARNELNVNSPSKVFMGIGGSVVEGFAAGISKNLGDVNNSAIELGSTMLKATKSYFEINSPSKVMKNEVGKYVVQGIAEGIKSDMSAEEAAKQKAQNIVDAFKHEIDKYDLDNATLEKGFSLWKVKDGKNASPAEIDAKETDMLNKTLQNDAVNVQLAYNEWEETVAYADQLGEDSAEIVQEAWNKYLDAELKMAETRDKILDIEEAANERARQILVDKQDINRLENDVADGLDSSTMSDTYRNKYKLENLKENIDLANETVTSAESKWAELCKQSKENTDEGRQAYVDMLNSYKDRDAAKQELISYIENTYDDRVEELEDAIDRGDKDLELWELMFGDKATEEERDAKNIANLKNTIDQADKIVAERTSAVKQYEVGTEEYTQACDDLKDALIFKARSEKNLADYYEGIAERENEQLKESYELASENADLRYQIWEKTIGRDATNSEKDAKKLITLSEQLTIQSNNLQVAQKEYNKAIEEYGKSSNEALSAYNNYLQEQLELANLQNEIADINESAIERQKNARVEYGKYLEKYEKYYLDHGMTREELEKDARLVSGYDPDFKAPATSSVNSILSGTANALNNISASSGYKECVSGFNNVGTSYVNAISEGASMTIPTLTSDIVELLNGCIGNVKEGILPTLTETITTVNDNCINTINGKQLSWTGSGMYLVTGFIVGIRSQIQAAAQAAAEMAAAALAAAKAELDINSPSRAFMEVGEYAVMGLAKGLCDYSELSENAASTLGGSVIDNLRDTIKSVYDIVNSEFDSQPTIRPVLDLSNVEAGAVKLNSMFSRTQAMRVSNSMSNHGEGIQNGVNTPSNGGNTYQFTQNNYSPKALSRAEIYRQTKNQFSAMKRTVKA